MLELIADLAGEKPLDAMTGLVDPDCVWRSLALMQKKVLASSSSASLKAPPRGSEVALTERLASCVIEDGSAISIPATSCSSPTKSTKNVVFSKSFLGGMQLNHRENDVLEYTLPGMTAGQYELTLRVCTVHLKQQPLLLTLQGNNGDDAVAVSTIVIPYTVGEWQYTKPVTVDLSSGTNILSFSRETPNFGLTIKDLTLKPSSVKPLEDDWVTC